MHTVWITQYAQWVMGSPVILLCFATEIFREILKEIPSMKVKNAVKQIIIWGNSIHIPYHLNDLTLVLLGRDHPLML